MKKVSLILLSALIIISTSMQYHFEKSGTGYITVDDYRTIDFTYEYTDETVDMTMHVPKPTNRESDVEYVDVHYRLETPSDGTPMKLIRTVEEDVDDGEGGKVHLKEEYVLTRL